MRTQKKIILTLLFLSLTILVGCNNDVTSSGGDVQNIIQTEITTEKTNYTTNIEKKKNTSEIKNMEKVTTVKIHKVETVKTDVTTTTATITLQTAVTGKVSNCTTNFAQTIEKSMVTEAITNVPTTVSLTNELILEPTTKLEPNVPMDSLVIKEVEIKLTFGDAAEQEMIDKNDAVYDEAKISNYFNTIILGHKEKGFNILDSMIVGEKFSMNYHGKIKHFEVQQSGLAELSEDGINLIYDGEELFDKDFGYHGLILVTCDKQDEVKHRWIVVGKEIE